MALEGVVEQLEIVQGGGQPWKCCWVSQGGSDGHMYVWVKVERPRKWKNRLVSPCPTILVSSKNSHRKKRQLSQLNTPERPSPVWKEEIGTCHKGVALGTQWTWLWKFKAEKKASTVHSLNLEVARAAKEILQVGQPFCSKALDPEFLGEDGTEETKDRLHAEGQLNASLCLAVLDWSSGACWQSCQHHCWVWVEVGSHFYKREESVEFLYLSLLSLFLLTLTSERKGMRSGKVLLKACFQAKGTA